MRHLTIALAMGGLLGLAAAFALPAQATTPGSIGGLRLPAASSPVEPAACRGPGPHCPPGMHWVCGPYGHRCWCAPC